MSVLVNLQRPLLETAGNLSESESHVQAPSPFQLAWAEAQDFRQEAINLIRLGKRLYLQFFLAQQGPHRGRKRLFSVCRTIVQLDAIRLPMSKIAKELEVPQGYFYIVPLDQLKL